MKRVLFLCTRNACRSQMAEAIVNRGPSGEVAAFSAGTDPAPVHPLAVEVLAEVGIDISGAHSKHVETFEGERFDLVVTLCGGAAASCPVVPGQGPRVHYGLDDPAVVPGTREERLEAFRRLRDEMMEGLAGFVRDALGLGR